MSDQSHPSNGLIVSGAGQGTGRTVALQREHGSLGGYGGLPAGADADGDLAAKLLEYWRILNKRKWIILGVLGAFVIFGTLRTLMMVPLYASTVRLQIDVPSNRLVEGKDSSSDSTDNEFQRTQYELLLSRSMAERVVSALKLGSDSDFFRPRQFSITDLLSKLLSQDAPAERPSAGASSNRDAGATAIMLGNRTVRPVSGSRLYDITYTDTSPTRAQAIAAAYAQAYVASTIDKRFEANSYSKTFLDDQLKQLKLRLEASDKALIDFAEKEQIITVTEKSSIAESNLASANMVLGNLEADRIKAEQMWRQVSGSDAISMPQFLTNGVVQSLRQQRSVLSTDYQEKLQTFKPGYPAMVESSKKIAELDRQIAAEVQTIKGTLKGTFENTRSQVEQMQKRVELLKAEVLDLQKRSLQYNLLKRDVDTNRALYDGLMQRYKEVDISSGIGANNVFVVDRPQLPGGPSSPNMPSAIFYSLVMGLGAGLAAAYLFERLDDRINSLEEMERITGIPTVGLIPKVDADSTVDDEVADPRSALSEAYRSLCTSLQFAAEGGLPKSLLITSASPSEGKSVTALAIARHFSIMGLKVLLVDSDLRKPSLHTKLGLDNSIGLSNYLTGSCTPPETFLKTGTPNLTFMPSGPVPPNAADLLAGTRFLSLISVGLQVFDLIVVDGPPVMGIADAPLLSNATAGTVFVASAGQGRVGLIRGSLKRLQGARAPVIGTVLTKFDAKRAGYGYGYGYGYGAGYGYGFGYGQPPAEPPAPPQSAAVRSPDRLMSTVKES